MKTGQKVLLLLASIVLHSVLGQDFPINQTTLISKNKVKEACFALSQNQQIQFSFKASDPIKFNLHYHASDNIFYPIGEQLTPEFKSTKFTAPETQTYCLMWSNPHAIDISLTYQIDRLP